MSNLNLANLATLSKEELARALQIAMDQNAAKDIALAAAKAASQRKLSLKVSEKGAVSLYGMGRFPVTLYAGQWERLLSASADITAFLETNRSLLAVKE